MKATIKHKEQVVAAAFAKQLVPLFLRAEVSHSLSRSGGSIYTITGVLRDYLSNFDSPPKKRTKNGEENI